MTKSLEADSRLDQYGLDHDGIVTDAEIDRAREIREFEDLHRKHTAQLRIARATLIGMAIFTTMMFMPFVPDTRIKLLGDISNLFFITGGGIIGAYMGVSAWMSRK